jgi:hypothetical protein
MRLALVMIPLVACRDPSATPGPDAGSPPDGPSSGTFGAGVAYGTDLEPVAIAIGDFNGDGRPDVAVANNKNQGTNINTIGTVSVLLTSVDGTLQPGQTFTAGFGPFGIAVGDLDRDGKLDLVTANLAQGIGGNLTVLIGNGDGTFDDPAPVDACCSPKAVVAGDLDRDGKLDLVVANFQNVQVVLGTSSGFDVPVPYAVPGDPVSVALGDLDNDGVLDVVAGYGNGNNPDTVAVLIGNGDGTLGTAVPYDNRGLARVGIADLDRDGVIDVVTADGTDSISVLRGTGTGTLLAPTVYPMGPTTIAATLGDFDGDGAIDVAATSVDGDAVFVRLNQGDGSLAASKMYPTLDGPVAVGTADFNDDGRADLAVVNQSASSVSIFLGQP